MKLKLRPTDFRVLELLGDGYVTERGEFRVYRVTKRKLTSPQAASALAAAAGVEVADVAMAGLKDRQGVTIQYMSVPAGKPVEIVEPDLRIESVGFAERPLESTDSAGNAFEINVRALTKGELLALRKNLDIVRRSGVPNYFDDQRFGNLRYHQGWVARDLMLGKHEDALRRLLCARSDHEGEDDDRFKAALDECWGDWERCFSITKRFGKHRSLFQHLVEYPTDFAGAFRYVATRIRLIHMYAWQSHLFNRALAARMRAVVPVERRAVLPCIEGPLVCPAEDWPKDLEPTLALPGAGLTEVSGAAEFDLFRDLLAEEGISPGQHRIEGIEGFGLKAERRELRVIPRHLRVRPPEPDRESRGLSMVGLRFELPRGAYASLVVKRLVATATDEASVRTGPPRYVRGESFEPRGERRDFERGGDRRDERSGDRRAFGRGDERGGRAPERREFVRRDDDREARPQRDDRPHFVRDDRGGRGGRPYGGAGGGNRGRGGDRPSRERDRGFHDAASEPRPANAPQGDGRPGQRSHHRENWRPVDPRRLRERHDGGARHWNSAPHGGASRRRDQRDPFHGRGDNGPGEQRGPDQRGNAYRPGAPHQGDRPRHEPWRGDRPQGGQGGGWRGPDPRGPHTRGNDGRGNDGRRDDRGQQRGQGGRPERFDGPRHGGPRRDDRNERNDGPPRPREND
jgi:tRNA pseudouridine13 synthase